MRRDVRAELETCYTFLETPVGRLRVAGDGSGLTEILFPGSRSSVPEPGPAWIRADEPFAEVARQLELYFAGELRRFELELRPVGTPFQLETWAVLQEIPYGTTRSYAEIAQAIGRPDAVRAVGAANGANPIPIVIPCHRVIGSAGDLTGFGGGIEIKQRLLELEGALPAKLF